MVPELFCACGKPPKRGFDATVHMSSHLHSSFLIIVYILDGLGVILSNLGLLVLPRMVVFDLPCCTMTKLIKQTGRHFSPNNDPQISTQKATYTVSIDLQHWYGVLVDWRPLDRRNPLLMLIPMVMVIQQHLHSWKM
jgi:hypothetical protein